ncbi:MAG: methyltransferase domain-containing protein [Cupriavidus sp.]|nr:MAG: methyltransferase domain-containing protein [Cupriavidus sp.]
MPDDENKELIESWNDNASAWTQVVREGKIESRKLVTDAAIIEAIRSVNPGKVLDLGCGEGWLCRRLRALGIATVGIDVSLPLIEAAKAVDDGTYLQRSYAEFCDEPKAFGYFDAVVANFSVLGDDLSQILSASRQALHPGGSIIVQTLHPGNIEQSDGWRVESFASFHGQFPKAMPWYFRSLASWQKCLEAAGLRIREIREPVHPNTGAPASLLLIAAI